MPAASLVGLAGTITGGRIGVVFGETLWRYLSALILHIELASDRAWRSIRPIIDSLLKVAIQGFGEDHTGLPARSRFGEGRSTRHSRLNGSAGP
jgi:hypothetical protein